MLNPYKYVCYVVRSRYPLLFPAISAGYPACMQDCKNTITCKNKQGNHIEHLESAKKIIINTSFFTCIIKYREIKLHKFIIEFRSNRIIF